MKAITLTQPWATLIALEQKHIETRNWQTSYRGPLAIHAGKSLGPVGGKKGLVLQCMRNHFFTSLLAVLPEHLRDRHLASPQCIAERLPYGAIVATCELIDIVSTNQLPVGWRRGEHAWWFTDQEHAFGDYSPNRYAWLLANVRALPTPVPTKGALSLWDYEGEL